MSKIEAIILLLILAFLKNPDQVNLLLNQPQNIQNSTNFEKKNLKSDFELLTPENIISLTNIKRKENNLSPLKTNELLNKSAELKVKDMLVNQYFDHYSPQGNGADFFITQVGYKPLIVGENLAMGNFKSANEVVEKWLQSEGHKKNILDSKYQEIGVAVKEGVFKGKKVIFIVQHFGTPEDVCPRVDDNLKLEIEKNKNKIDQLQIDLKEKEREILEIQNFDFGKINNLINEYNQLVNKYNSLVQETKFLIEKYNKMIEEYNFCIAQFKN